MIDKISLTESAWAITCVWRRYLDVFRKDLWYGLLTTMVDPLLYLVSFGFGMGAIIPTIEYQGHPVSYRAFVLAGVLGQTVLFQGFFEAAYGGFVRMYYQKIFRAMASTPITLSEVLWGESIWVGTRATLSASAVLLIGVILGDFRPMGALITLPLTFIFGFLFGGLGMWVAAKSRTIESIAYPQYLVVFPMFLFCGVFFPVEKLPSWAQGAAAFVPLTGILSIVRGLTLGTAIQWHLVPIVVGWLGVFVYCSRRAMRKRMIK